jgi:hypothetical protein
MSASKFQLGRLLATPNALAQLTQTDITTALARHVQGDWGEVDTHDRQENEFSLKEGFRLFSVYRSKQDVKFWIITEADRSLTTVLMPADY